MQNNNKIDSGEIGCTLSHIKAILSLTNTEGSYFLICEDDIILDNVYMFNHDLKHIINNCPPFDILMLYKTYIDKLLIKTYTKWNDLGEKPGGTLAYVISRQGIKNFSKYNKMENSVIYATLPFSVADDYIYKNLNTYVYKYNFITTDPMNNSTLHDHTRIHSLVCRTNILDMQYKYFHEDNA